MLSTEDGDSLGTIVSSAIQIQQADLFDVKQDAVEVVTSSRTLRYSPSEHVFIWDLPTDEVAIERKMQLFERLGSGLTQVILDPSDPLIPQIHQILQWNTERAVTVTSIGTVRGTSSVWIGARHTDRSVTVALRPSSDAARTSSTSSRSDAASAR